MRIGRARRIKSLPPHGHRTRLRHSKTRRIRPVLESVCALLQHRGRIKHAAAGLVRYRVRPVEHDGCRAVAHKLRDFPKRIHELALCGRSVEGDCVQFQIRSLHFSYLAKFLLHACSQYMLAARFPQEENSDHHIRHSGCRTSATAVEVILVFRETMDWWPSKS